MNSARHIDPEDLTLFALQFLGPQANATVSAHLESCDACRQDLGMTEGELALVACTAETHSPPALARERLLQQVAREARPKPVRLAEEAASESPRAIANRTLEARSESSSQIPSQIPSQTSSQTSSQISSQSRLQARPDTRPERPGVTLFQAAGAPAVARMPRGLGRGVLAWSGWAIAAALLVAVFQLAGSRGGLEQQVTSANHQIAQVSRQAGEARRLMETLNDPAAQRVTLTASRQAAVPQARVTYVAASGALVLAASNLAPLDAAKVYELWIIPSGDSAPLPAGTFQPDAGGSASLLLPKVPAGITAKAFGITIEDSGGSQTPTMPIIMAGAAGL